MKREIQHVSFGYEPPVQTRKGTLIFYDTFEDTTDEELNGVLETALARSFQKLVLYPLHEETVRRMFSRMPVSAYHKREKRLQEWKQEQSARFVTVESWEGRRKKYTPFEATVRHLAENYDSPLFFYVHPGVAEQLASYSSFAKIITSIRLILTEPPAADHPVLNQFRSRWQVAGEEMDGGKPIE